MDTVISGWKAHDISPLRTTRLQNCLVQERGTIIADRFNGKPFSKMLDCFSNLLEEASHIIVEMTALFRALKFCPLEQSLRELERVVAHIKTSV